MGKSNRREGWKHLGDVVQPMLCLIAGLACINYSFFIKWFPNPFYRKSPMTGRVPISLFYTHLFHRAIALVGNGGKGLTLILIRVLSTFPTEEVTHLRGYNGNFWSRRSTTPWPASSLLLSLCSSQYFSSLQWWYSYQSMNKFGVQIFMDRSDRCSRAN